MKYLPLIFLYIALFTTPAFAALHTEEVSYKHNDTVMKGYLAYDDSVQTKRPGILVVHEWWGHNAYARKRAEMLAEIGYTALAIDMYGDGKTANHPNDAGKFAGEIRKNMPVAVARFTAAMKLLQEHPTVASDKIAAIGYCFGGGVVLEMARAGIDLEGVVSFHGSLAPSTPAQPGKVKAKVLVFNGAEDPFVKPEEIAAFTQEMENAGVKFSFVNYPGAKHSFTNPDADKFGSEFNLPLAYNKEADEQSWQAMQIFFEDIFQGPSAEGMLNVASDFTVTETANRLENILQEKGMTVFARIKHSAGAKKVGIELRDTELVIFGNPKVGSPLMQCQQSVAIDLPQKALIWQDANGETWISYNDPRYLEKRHTITGCEAIIAKIEKALAAITQVASTK